MSEFNDPAHPLVFTDGNGYRFVFKGTTIRQQAALMAMQGILANPSIEVTTGAGVAADAIRVADAVLRAERESRE